MTATYTWDAFSTLDGYGSYVEGAAWGGYWSRQGPQLLEHRAQEFREPQRLVLGAATFREMAGLLVDLDPDVFDEWNAVFFRTPTTVITSGSQDAMGWPDATFETGDAAEIVARLKRASSVPLRSHGSIALNRSLMAAGLVDRLQVTIFPVLTGATGASPIFAGFDDFELELLEQRVLDDRTIEVVYRPTLRAAS